MREARRRRSPARATSSSTPGRVAANARGRPAPGTRDRTARRVTASVSPPPDVRLDTRSTRQAVAVRVRKRAVRAASGLTPGPASACVVGRRVPADRYSTPRPASASADRPRGVAVPRPSTPQIVVANVSEDHALQIATLTQTSASACARRKTAPAGRSSIPRPASVSVGRLQDAAQIKSSIRTRANVNAARGNALPTKCLTPEHVSASARKGCVLGLRFSIPRPASVSVGRLQDAVQIKSSIRTHANVNAARGNALPTKCLTPEHVNVSARKGRVLGLRSSIPRPASVSVG